VGRVGLTEGEEEVEEEDDDGKGGDCEREDGSVCMATSTFFSKSSCIIPDNDVWSMVSINETAPIKLDK